MKVGELIKALQAFPLDAPIVIDDADTGRALNVEPPLRGYGEWAEAVYITGSYSSEWRPTARRQNRTITTSQPDEHNPGLMHHQIGVIECSPRTVVVDDATAAAMGFPKP